MLIHGASGSVGTYAAQLAKYYGAEVTAVCSPKKVLVSKGAYVSTRQIAHFSLADLRQLKRLHESGNIRVVIDRIYSFKEIPDAHRYVESFHKRDNVVIDLAKEAR